jgi:hypothetical protein
LAEVGWCLLHLEAGVFAGGLFCLVLVFALSLLLGSGNLLSSSVFVSFVRVFSVSSQQLLTWRVSNYVCFPLNVLAEHLPFSSKKQRKHSIPLFISYMS